MKLKTRMMLKNINDDYIQEQLKLMIKNNELNDEQIQYIITNTNINKYILQNAIPIANAMKKGIPIENIEYIANLLDDATKYTIFSLESGKGALFNKIPLTLDFLLNMEDINPLNREKYQTITNVINNSMKLKTSISIDKQLLTITDEQGKWINEENCKLIEKYNKAVTSYFYSNQNKSFFKDPPYIDDLLKSGMTLSQLANIDFENIEFFYMNILADSAKLLQNDDFKEIQYTGHNGEYYLKIEKIENAIVLPDKDGNLQYHDDTTISFQNINDEKDYISIKNDRSFFTQLCHFAENQYDIKYIQNNIVKDKFIDYCENNISHKKDYYYWKDYDNQIHKSPIIFKLKELREFGETYVLMANEFDTDSLVFIPKNNISDMIEPFSTKMIDTYTLLSYMDFYDISSEFYDNVVNNWNNLGLDEVFDHEYLNEDITNEIE